MRELTESSWLTPRQAAYPEQIGGLDIYTAVMDDGIRTLAEFGAWLDRRGRGDAG